MFGWIDKRPNHISCITGLEKVYRNLCKEICNNKIQCSNLKTITLLVCSNYLKNITHFTQKILKLLNSNRYGVEWVFNKDDQIKTNYGKDDQRIIVVFRSTVPHNSENETISYDLRKRIISDNKNDDTSNFKSLKDYIWNSNLQKKLKDLFKQL